MFTLAPSLCASSNACRKATDSRWEKLNDQNPAACRGYVRRDIASHLKYAASLPKCRNELRLPMVPVSKANEKQIKDALVQSILDMVEAA
jgi:dihydrodipicolinate synthase/N-acetylneuraminate lyase